MVHLLSLPALALFTLVLGSSASASFEGVAAEQDLVAPCEETGEALRLWVTANGRVFARDLDYYLDERSASDLDSSHPSYASDLADRILLSVHFENGGSSINVEVSDGPGQPWSDHVTLQPGSDNYVRLWLGVGQSFRLVTVDGPQTEDLLEYPGKGGAPPHRPPTDRTAVLRPVNSCTE